MLKNILQRRIFRKIISRDCGTVTAEFAVVLPWAVVIALALLGLGRAVICTMNCHDAAMQVTYYMVTHRNDSAASSIVEQIAGPGASVQISRGGNTVNIVVKCPLIPDPLHILPAMVESHVNQVLA